MKQKRKTKTLLSLLILSMGAGACMTACGGQADNSEPLSAYQGERMDENGRSVYNTELFYSNQIVQGGPDPQVLDDTARSGYYYLYSTLKDFHVSRSKNLMEWDDVGFSLPTNQTPEIKRITSKNLWAPEVIYDSTREEYIMFFSASPEYDTNYAEEKEGIVHARSEGTYTYNLYLATSKSPEGPFKVVNFEDESTLNRLEVHHVNKQTGIVLSSEELADHLYVEQDGVYYEAAFPHYYQKYCYLAPDALSIGFQKEGWSDRTIVPEPTYFGCIDPSPFVDPATGEKILYFKAEDGAWNVMCAIKMKNNNWLTPDWDTFTIVGVNDYYTVEDWKNGGPRGVSYEQNKVNEGPHMIYHKDAEGNARYYLSFSVNGYGDSSYQVGTMVADSPMGPFRKLQESEGGLLICSTTTESQTISGAGHHSYIKAGSQEFIIYHRHIDYEKGGGARYTAVDEMKWLPIEDIYGNYLEVPYLNGPTDSLQPLPEKYSDYKNVALSAEVSCSDGRVNAEAINDGFLTVHKTASDEFIERIPEAKLTQTSTFTLKFSQVETLRSIMVYNSTRENELFRNVSKMEIVQPDGTVKSIKNVRYDMDQYADYVEEIDEVGYSMSGSCAFAEFYDINATEVRVTVDMPAGLEQVGISEIKVLGRKQSAIVKNNDEEYTFENEQKFVAIPDADMTIDGKFNEERWNESVWLHGKDVLNAIQSADIDFTTSFGEKGIYFGIKVHEKGTSIFVNKDRASYFNSQIEMYMGPIGDPNYRTKMFEFDFMADGSYCGKINVDGFAEIKIAGEKMPVIASTPIGGEINSSTCTGYEIEAFFPKAYLEAAGYDLSDYDNMVLGINPVHIFSFDYAGEEMNQSRYWSDWAKGFIGAQWLQPSTFFQFGKNGLIANKLNIVTGGTGKGTVELSTGNDYVLIGTKPTITMHAKNGTKVSRLALNGQEIPTTSLRKIDNSTYVYTLESAVSGDLTVEVDFN